MALQLLASATDLSTIVGMAPDDPRVTLALRRAGDRFRGETQNPIDLITDDEIWLSGDDSAKLLLPHAPVVGEPSLVELDGQAVIYTAPSSATTQADDTWTGYGIRRRTGILVREAPGAWKYGEENVHVIYTHGYTEVPGDIADAVLEHATTLATTYAHIQQESGGSNSASYQQAALVGVTQKWVETVQKYRLGDR